MDLALSSPLTKRTDWVIRPAGPLSPPIKATQRAGRGGGAIGRPNGRRAGHPEGSARYICPTGQRLLATPVPRGAPAENQASAPMGSHRFPRCKGRFGSESFLRHQATGNDEGPRGRRTPHTSACHEARGHAGRFSRQRRERCARTSYSTIRAPAKAGALGSTPAPDRQRSSLRRSTGLPSMAHKRSCERRSSGFQARRLRLWAPAFARAPAVLTRTAPSHNRAYAGSAGARTARRSGGTRSSCPGT